MLQMLGARFYLVDNSVYNFHARRRTNACAGKAPIVEFDRPA